jgi:hypothetical protein
VFLPVVQSTPVAVWRPAFQATRRSPVLPARHTARNAGIPPTAFAGIARDIEFEYGTPTTGWDYGTASEAWACQVSITDWAYATATGGWAGTAVAGWNYTTGHSDWQSTERPAGWAYTEGHSDWS